MTLDTRRRSAGVRRGTIAIAGVYAGLLPELDQTQTALPPAPLEAGDILGSGRRKRQARNSPPDIAGGSCNSSFCYL